MSRIMDVLDTLGEMEVKTIKFSDAPVTKKQFKMNAAARSELARKVAQARKDRKLRHAAALAAGTLKLD
jgi:hypothetical protein